MTREHIIMVLGALVFIAPWSGLPLSWLEWALPIIGLLVIGLAATLRRRTPSNEPPLPPAPPSDPSRHSSPPARQLRQQPEPRGSHIAFS